MNVLVVSGLYTHPHNQGNLQGIYRECKKMLELGWNVDFLYWGDYLHANLKGMENFFGKEHLFFANVSNNQYQYEVRKFIRNYLDKKKVTRYLSVPYAPDELHYNEIQEKVNVLHKTHHYDIVWLEYYLQSKIFESLDSNILKVVHTHDRFTNRNKIFQRDGKVPEFYYLTKKGERKALSRADVVIAVQEKECQFFEKLVNGTNTICLSIGNFIEKRDIKAVYNHCYGFLGSINDANIDAVKLFIKKYLPVIKKHEPDSQFVIAGGVCKNIPDNEQYIKMGYIDNIEDFYETVSFVVTPMLAGTGLNIKNIEALSFGKPIVTTSIGAKGLDGAQNAMKIADKDTEYIDNVIYLLQNQEEINRMSMEAKEFVEKYNEENVSKYRYIEKLVQERNS